jgi:cytochrome c2
MKIRMARMLMALLSFGSVVARADNSELVFSDHGQAVLKLTLEKIEAKVSPEDLSVYEAHEKRNAHYRAVPVGELFTEVYGPGWKKAEDVTFVCQDGYRQAVPVEKLVKERSLLAVDRKDPRLVRGFTLVNRFQKNELVHLGPYYLIWDNLNGAAEKQEMPQDAPYQIVQINLTNFSDLSPHSAPTANSSKTIRDGFLSFRNHCAACHAVNGDGGKKAIELNQPASVTKRFADAKLKQWILNPRSINPDSKMLALRDFSPHPEATADDIISYLKFLAAGSK